MLLNIKATLIFVSNSVKGDNFTIVENIFGSVSEGTIDEEKITNKRAMEADAVIADSYELKMYPTTIPKRLKITVEISIIASNE